MKIFEDGQAGRGGEESGKGGRSLGEGEGGQQLDGTEDVHVRPPKDGVQAGFRGVRQGNCNKAATVNVTE